MWWWLSADKRGVPRSPHYRSVVSGAAPQLREALPLITAEFERARRYERTVTIGVFTVVSNGTGSGPSGPEDGRNGAATENDRLLPGVLTSVVREAMRETDLVACDAAARRCIVVMPEIGPEEGRRAVGRIRQLCAARLGCAVRGDTAVFPRDGWMFLDLVDVAQRHARPADEPPVVVPASHQAV